MTDKNLGHVIMEKKQYIKRTLDDHLCDGITYKELTKNDAFETLGNFKEDLFELLCVKHKRALKENKNLLQTGIQTMHPHSPILRDTKDPHTNGSPCPLLSPQQ